MVDTGWKKCHYMQKYFFNEGLNIALVPANMPCLSFGPCKKKMFLVPAKFFVF